MKQLTIATYPVNDNGSWRPTKNVKSYVESRGHRFITVTDQKHAYTVHFDRLILLGGNDIHPFYYGEPVIESVNTDKNRDATEWIMIRRAIAAEIPTMGICRGSQMITIANGGSLHQDIRNCLNIDHDAYTHKITAKKKLKDRMPELIVNSFHHQCTNVVPYGFDVLATSEGGKVIEAIWRPGMLGVQWHPEMMLPRDHRWSTLFDWWLDGLQ